ncbi:hypothetical protein [Pseudoduganella sp. OTU4001]|uniref:hypothetical protein n=1 Tax=Pseudoduganella sp. OTU4001 TaxID=3043854 RepID=UPI00313AD76C
MKSVIALLLAATMSTSALADNPNPDANQVQAAHKLLTAMQAEKMLRMKAGMSRYATPQERDRIMGKVMATPSEYVYTKMAKPVARLLSPETVVEMTRFYESTYGKKVLDSIYNSGAQLYPTMPKATKSEQAELKKPAYLKADQEFKANERAIQQETFLLLKEIAKTK